MLLRGVENLFKSSRFNNDAQSRYSPIEGEALTVYWATSKADYFIYGCDKLYIGVDHKPLLAFFRKVDTKPLDHIVNKRLRKYVSEINALRFTISTFQVHIFFCPTGALDFSVVKQVLTGERVMKVQYSLQKQSATKVQRGYCANQS